MKTIFGVLICVLGVFIGLYVGLYLCFYGGIVQIIDGVKAGLDASDIGFGSLRVVCASFCGVMSFYCTFAIGASMIFK